MIFGTSNKYKPIITTYSLNITKGKRDRKKEIKALLKIVVSLISHRMYNLKIFTSIEIESVSVR